MMTKEGVLYYLRENVNPVELTRVKEFYLYNYQFEPFAKPILVDSTGHEYKFTYESDLEGLTYMGMPFSVMYLGQAPTRVSAPEEASLMDRVTRIPAPVIDNSRGKGPVIPTRVIEPGTRPSLVSQPTLINGGFVAVTGSSMPHHTERPVRDVPTGELPRGIPARMTPPGFALPEVYDVPGARRFIAESQPMRPSSQVAVYGFQVEWIGRSSCTLCFIQAGVESRERHRSSCSI